MPMEKPWRLHQENVMNEMPIYGTARIADYLGISESALRRRYKQPSAQFIQIGSMGNVGGGLGLGRWSLPSSLDNYRLRHQQEASDIRRAAANKRWHSTEVSSGSGLRTK